MSAADKAVRLIALAYGCGRHLEDVADRFAVSVRTQEGGSDDEENSNVADGFYVTKQTETLMQAGRAINPKDREQARHLSRCEPDHLLAAQEWSDSHRLAPRGRGLPYRVSEFEHWKTVTKNIVMVPRARPTSRVMDALADADLDGPLEHLLMFAATQEAKYWPKVRLHAVACGHAGWACDEAGLLMAIGDCRKEHRPHDLPRRRQSDRAKANGMRAETYALAVRAARSLLEEWLHRAAVRLLEAMAPESGVALNHGEPSALMAETWLRPDRYEKGRTLKLDAAQALEHCRRHPAQMRIYPPASVTLAAERKTAAAWKAIDAEAVAALESAAPFLGIQNIDERA